MSAYTGLFFPLHTPEQFACLCGEPFLIVQKEELTNNGFKVEYND
jgi:hypothetical protein